MEPVAVLHIEPLNHRDPAVAHCIHAVLASAHTQELELLQLDGDSLSERTVDEIRCSNEYFLGAYQGQTLAGVVSIGPDDEPKQLSIASLSVHAEHQRQGVGRQLVSDALRRGNGAAFSVVSAAANVAALALYRGLGFQEYRRGVAETGGLEMVKLRHA